MLEEIGVNKYIALRRFKKQMAEKGYFVFENFAPGRLGVRMRNELESAYKHCRKIQTKNKLPNTEGTAHHLVEQGESFTEYLELFEDLNIYAEEYFHGKYILNAFGGNILSRGLSYAGNIHRDIRTFSGDLPLMLNTIVMLDDFTKANGATWLMRGGHKLEHQPTQVEFDMEAFQLTGSAGTVVFFNSNMWHQAGVNTTSKPRRSITPMFTRPFYKQQFDYTQFCDNKSSEWVKQLLGYYSRTPKTLHQWYQLEENRMYRKNQG